MAASRTRLGLLLDRRTLIRLGWEAGGRQSGRGAPFVNGGKMIPTFSGPVGGGDLVTPERLHRLEHALGLSLTVLQRLAEVLESKFGPEVLGAQLRALAAVAADGE